MPRKSKAKPKTMKIKIVAAAVLVVLGLFGAGLAYARQNDISLKIGTGGGQAVGVWWDDQGRPHIEAGRFGCCAPFCVDMFEIECSREYGYDGTFSPGRCDYDVPECAPGCCLPLCQHLTKVQCEGDVGYGVGEWQLKQCRDIPECELGCCLQDGIKFEEMQAPCQDAGGNWSAGECKLGYTVDMEAEYSVMLGVYLSETHSKFHFYTCSNSLYGPWNGVQNYSITTSHEGGSKTTSHETIYPLIFNDEGVHKVRAQGLDVEATVNESIMTLTQSTVLGDKTVTFTTSGEVKAGAVECEGR